MANRLKYTALGIEYKFRNHPVCICIKAAKMTISLSFVSLLTIIISTC